MKNECKKGVTNSTPCCQACTVGCVVFPWVSPRGAVVRRAPRVFLSKDHWTSGYTAAPSLPMIHTGYFLNCSFHYSSVSKGLSRLSIRAQHEKKDPCEVTEAEFLGLLDAFMRTEGYVPWTQPMYSSVHRK